MRQTTKRLALLVFGFLFGISTWAQNLTPHQLFQINNDPDFSIVTNILVDKGFKFQSKQYDDLTRKTEGRWYFQPFTHSGEEVSSYLIKMVDSTHKAKTIFLLYNPFHYKEFISSLIKSKYVFTGIMIIDNKSYTVFKNKRKEFLTTEKQDANKHTFFEITVQTE